MGNNIYKIYIKEVNKIKQNSGVHAIFLVGSSKNKDFIKEANLINDIDLFVICDNIENQMRIIKEVNGLSFDINYFSKKYCKEMVKDQELFFIREIKNAKVEFDKEDLAQDLIKACKESFDKGPEKLKQCEKDYIKYELHSNLKKIKNNENINKLQYDFLTNLFLKDIIIGYFRFNNIWLPKDKKLINALYYEDKELYVLIENAFKTKNYEDLRITFVYMFGDEDINNHIKLIY